MKRYFVHCPGIGQVYAWNFYGNNEREARKAAREWMKVDRLPKGTEVWEG